MKRDFKPVHPGVVLKEIIEELGISQARLARDIGVSPMRISHIINASRPMTGDDCFARRPLRACWNITCIRIAPARQ